MLCSSNSRRLTLGGFRQRVLAGLPADGGPWRVDPAPMPPDFTGTPYLQTLWVRRTGVLSLPESTAGGKLTGG